MSDKPAFVSAAPFFNEAALLAIFDQYAPAIYKYALRLCYDPIASDNLVGEVFTLFLTQFAADGCHPNNLRSCLYRIAYRLIQNHAFRGQYLTTDVITEASVRLIDESAPGEEQARMHALVSVMNSKLSEIQRHVIILRFLEGFSLRETAAIVSKGVDDVEAIQNRGIVKLRNSLGFQAENDQQELFS